MGERRHVLRPVMESCESRAMLSGGFVSAPAAHPAATSPIERAVKLDGILRGNYKQPFEIPDVGSTFDFTGSGQVKGFGHAFVTGQLHSIGFIAQGHAQGTVRLSGVHGTLTLSLTGPVQQGGPAGLPDHFVFKTVGGTGKYRKVSDTGTASLVTIPGSATGQSMGGLGGTFTLRLTSNPIPAT
jgi:hypothetical protein